MDEGVGGGLVGTHFRRQLVELRMQDRHLRHDTLLFGAWANGERYFQYLFR